MQIQKVALIGAGAVGSYFIWGLSQPLGQDFCVIAEGERKKRLERDGLEINGKHYDLNVRTPDEARGADLVLVATKYAALPDALGQIRAAADDHTIVMSLLNGVDSEEIIAQVIPEKQIMNAFMVIASMRRGESICFDPDATEGLRFGDKHTPEKTPACAAVEALFEKSSCRARFVPDIETRQWVKFARNISLNLPQAIVGCGTGAYLDSQHMKRIAALLEEEVRQTAAAYGHVFGAVPQPDFARQKAARYSTLQDLDAKRPTEIDMFCGVLMKKAAARNIPVPCATMAYHLIKALEEKNEGRFDYPV